MNPNCCWDRELPRADCVVCHSKVFPFGWIWWKENKKKHDALCPVRVCFQSTKIIWSPNHNKYSVYSVTAAVYITRYLRASLYKFTSTQSFEPQAITTHAGTDRRMLIDKKGSRLSWWHWLILSLRVPFSCLVLIECNSRLAPLHQIRQ